MIYYLMNIIIVIYYLVNIVNAVCRVYMAYIPPRGAFDVTVTIVYVIIFLSRGALIGSGTIVMVLKSSSIIFGC